MASNASKPHQAQLIEACGLRTPPTLVTNDPDAVRAFARRHRRLVYKSTSSMRSIVRELRGSAAAGIERVRNLPTQFQAFVPGTDVRVHVAGSAVFAAEIASDVTDYRYAAQEGRAVTMAPLELPADLRERCLALSAALELPLCGIDLRRTPEGEWVCFEVNPSPAYSWYEERTGQPIARALVAYLSGEQEGSRGAGRRELD
jgi:glutathione synthase/RimK-type ligase-like ATP-grasp enzyme